MAAKTITAEAKPVLWRIGEVAKLTGVTSFFTGCCMKLRRNRDGPALSMQIAGDSA